MEASKPTLTYQDIRSCETTSYCESDNGTWKLVTTMDFDLGSFFEYAHFSQDGVIFLKTWKPMPSDVRAAFDKVNPISVKILESL